MVASRRRVEAVAGVSCSMESRRSPRLAITTQQVVVSTTAVALSPVEPGSDVISGVVLFVKNTDGANGAALGASGVTAGTGFRLVAGATIGPLNLEAGDQLFAIRTGAADVTLDVFRIGV